MKTNNIIYRRIGDYNIPNLTLSSEETNIRLGEWGMLYKDYLLKHKKVLFGTLLAEGKPYQHCAEVENMARDMFDTLVEQMKECENITKQLKAEKPLEWTQKVSNICNRVEKIVIREFVII